MSDGRPLIYHATMSKNYCSGLSRDTTTDSMRAYFESFGEVKDAVVKIDANTGASRGFGFVIFSNEASIDAVFASGSHEIDGKKVCTHLFDKCE